MPEPVGTQTGRDEALREKLAKLHAALLTLESTQRKGKRLQVELAILLLLAFVWFGGAIYRHLQTFTTQNLLPVVAERAGTFLPEVTEVAANVWDRTLPVYVDEFRKQAPAYAPRMTQIAHGELLTFFEQLEKDTHAHILQLVDRFARPESIRLAQSEWPSRDASRPPMLEHNLNLVLRESLQMVLMEKLQGLLDPVYALQHTIAQYQREVGGRAEPDVELKFLATGLELVSRRLVDDVER